MIAKTISFMALAATISISMIGTCRAEAANVFQATLGEAGRSPEVSTEQLQEILRDRSAILLDTRTRAEFDAGHIPGARNLDSKPQMQIAAVLDLVQGDKSKALVLYCNGPYCQASRRLSEQLIDAGFGNVRRYQLGIPVWRALGGPVAMEIGGVLRVLKADRSAVLVDARPAADFARSSLPGAVNAPVDDVLTGQLKVALPEDDFNRRIILFGNGEDSRKLANYMSKRPWHNVSYFPGDYDALAAALKN